MKEKRSIYFKPILIIGITMIAIVTLVILFISPLTKHLIEKYDEEYTGRQIIMDRAYVNPFTGYIHLKNLRIFEQRSDSVFFSTNGISVNISLLKLFSKTYELSELTLDHPQGIIMQNKKEFNFSDLINKFSSKDSAAKKEPIHFNILNIKINDGVFYYHEKQIPINYFIKDVNIESAGMRWDVDTIAVKFSFLSGMGSGSMEGDYTMDIKKMNYRMALKVHKFDMNIVEQYLKDLTNYGNFSAILDANIKSRGSFKDEEDVTTSGRIVISDFHFGKNIKDDYVSVDSLILAIHELSPKKHIYYYDSISVNHPYFKYERYDYLDNVQTMFGRNGVNISEANSDSAKFNLIIEIANHIKVLSKNFFKSNYKINRFAVYKADIKFNDYSINEKFSIELTPLSIIADSIEKLHKRVNVKLKSGIKPYGNMSIALSISPQDSSDFDLQFHFLNLSAAVFNPYIISYTSFPLDRGSVELNGNWRVRNGNIISQNHLLIIDPRITKRMLNKNIRWIPMRLIMTFIRERGNVIDYEIPISGDLKNPKFHVRDVVFDLAKNIFVKPPTTPYRMEVKHTETEIEKSLTLKWEMRQHLLRNNQTKFIKKITEFLVENPGATISVSPHMYSAKEKEYILYYEAKKKYFLKLNQKNRKSFSEDDAETVDQMSIKDSVFVRYLNNHIENELMFTMMDKCSRFVGMDTVNILYDKLNSERETEFLNYFQEAGVKSRVSINQRKDVIPYNGFSFYQIEYNGIFPESLIEANGVMNQLNDESPRKKFFKKRKKIKKEA